MVMQPDGGLKRLFMFDFKRAPDNYFNCISNSSATEEQEFWTLNDHHAHLMEPTPLWRPTNDNNPCSVKIKIKITSQQ